MPLTQKERLLRQRQRAAQRVARGAIRPVETVAWRENQGRSYACSAVAVYTLVHLHTGVRPDWCWRQLYRTTIASHPRYEAVGSFWGAWPEDLAVVLRDAHGVDLPFCFSEDVRVVVDLVARNLAFVFSYQGHTYCAFTATDDGDEVVAVDPSYVSRASCGLSRFRVSTILARCKSVLWLSDRDDAPLPDPATIAPLRRAKGTKGPLAAGA